MQPRSKALIAIAGILTVLLVLFVIATRPVAGDADQIAAQTEILRAAGERRSASRIMSVVSADYRDSVILNTDQLNLFLRRTLGKSDAIHIQYTNANVTINGATAISRGHLRASTVSDNHILTDQDITLHWRREQGRRWLVFPTPVWRLTSAEYSGADLGE